MDELYKMQHTKIGLYLRLPSSVFISHRAPIPFFQDDIIHGVDNPRSISKQTRDFQDVLLKEVLLHSALIVLNLQTLDLF